MRILSALFISGLLGFLVLFRLLRGVPLPQKKLFLFSASLPAGFGISSLILFFFFLVSPPHAKELSIVGSTGLLILMIIDFIGFHLKHPGNRTSTTKNVGDPLNNNSDMISKVLTAAAFLLFAYTAVTILQLYFLSVSTNIPGGWDARYFWSLKAKFMFRSPENWQLIFSPKLPWSNPGYPLLWPNTLVWGWEWSGRESMIWSPIVSFVFYIASTFLLVWYLSSYSSAATGWLAGSFFMVLIPPLFWTLNQYADTPVTFFMTAGGFMLASALRSKNTRLLGISGLMGGLAAWTKNEGLIFLAWIYCIWATLSVFQGKKGDRVWRELKALCAGASVPLFAVLILKYLSRNSRTPAVIPHQSLANLSILLTSGAEQAWTIARSFYNDMKLFAPWKGLWGFFLLAAIFLALRKERLKSQGGILLFTVLLINAGYFAVLMLTSPDLLSWQIRTALDRLVIHTSILATAFAFETLTFGRSVPQK